MPIPKPRKDESEAQFISRCMGDSTMNKEYPDQKQRTAICYSQWRKKGESMEIDQKLDNKGRKIIAENVNIIFTGEMVEDKEE